MFPERSPATSSRRRFRAVACGWRLGTGPAALYHSGFHIQFARLVDCHTERCRKAGSLCKNQEAGGPVLTECSDTGSEYGLVIEYGGNRANVAVCVSTGASRRALQMGGNEAEVGTRSVTSRATAGPCCRESPGGWSSSMRRGTLPTSPDSIPGAIGWWPPTGSQSRPTTQKIRQRAPQSRGSADLGDVTIGQSRGTSLPMELWGRAPCHPVDADAGRTLPPPLCRRQRIDCADVCSLQPSLIPLPRGWECNHQRSLSVPGTHVQAPGIIQGAGNWSLDGCHGSGKGEESWRAGSIVNGFFPPAVAGPLAGGAGETGAAEACDPGGSSRGTVPDIIVPGTPGGWGGENRKTTERIIRLGGEAARRPPRRSLPDM
jgi:hypothetical protein